VLQPHLKFPDPVEVQAGGENPKRESREMVFELSQCAGTGQAGAPCDIAGDLVVLVLLQSH
jgi:hypothetical protein